MQPALIPWGGFFSLAMNVDLLVILDVVNFSKGGAQNRFFMNHKGQKVTYTVPVYHKHVDSKLIKDIEIRTDKYPKNLVSRLRIDFPAKKIINHEVLENIIQIINYKYTKLVQLNVSLIKESLRSLGIQVEMIMASSLENSDTMYETPVDRLIDILEITSGTDYIMPSRSLDYAQPLINKFWNKGCKTYSISYEQKEYPSNTNFIPNLSVLDLMLHADKSEWLSLIQASSTLRQIK
ncbi:WbqC family protein [Synechococcus sp. BIOS-U3-1]|uniref:WbqC family protein n=1 Tax=Synechococcus sp. BIOS-U3-1 TaxID=1400865 RepID=UPI001647F456|nr:WbqC family protein [Synechococcus sp. BIOS-U3-1]